MILLPQDLYIVLKLACLEDWTFRSLSEQVLISTSQIHLGLHRSEIAGLYSSSRRQLNSSALEEFVLHGVRYAYPIERGALVTGLPTSYAAPPLNKSIVQTTQPPPVWPHSKGVVGYTVEPLHPKAPEAALLDENFYELLALVDALREGRARERKLAAKHFSEQLNRAKVRK